MGNAGFIVQLIKYQKKLGIKRTRPSDLPSASDLESSQTTEDEEKSPNVLPKPLALTSMSSTESVDSLSLNDTVNGWENGRRPSLFTALAKLRGLKKRAVSTESVDSGKSGNISQ